LEEKELKVKYTRGGDEKKKVIFLEHMMDLFAEGVRTEDIRRIVAHAAAFPENDYMIQTKNPGRIVNFIGEIPARLAEMGERLILGVTIETDRSWIAKKIAPGAPGPWRRFMDMKECGDRFPRARKFVTVEPICMFDGEIADWIQAIRPHWVNIGADSKKTGLPEPTGEMIGRLIDRLVMNSTEVREKPNLARLMK
jgi:protein gp37